MLLQQAIQTVTDVQDVHPSIVHGSQEYVAVLKYPYGQMHLQKQGSKLNGATQLKHSSLVGPKHYRQEGSHRKHYVLKQLIAHMQVCPTRTNFTVSVQDVQYDKLMQVQQRYPQDVQSSLSKKEKSQQKYQKID